MARSLPAAVLACIALAVLPTATPEGADAAARPPSADVFVRVFSGNPLSSGAFVLEGDALPRLRWIDDAPAFAGDRPGSLVALYDSRLSPGRAGFALPESWSERDAFWAAAVLSIDPEDFIADPFGFFQISWGLWNTRTTGFERTGTLTNFAGDTFDLLEFDYFPNVSPFFGGPFVSPTVFGRADRDNPLFPFLGAFANSSFGSSQAALPTGEPLVALLHHLPDEGVVRTSLYRIAGDTLEEIDAARTDVPLSWLSLREFRVDTLGLTLWRDGFGGERPSLHARVEFHAFAAGRGTGFPTDLRQLLGTSGRGR